MRDPWELEDQGEIIGIALWHCSLQTFPNDRIHYIDNFQSKQRLVYRGVGVYYGALVHSLFSLVKDNAGVSFFGRKHVFQHGKDRNDAAAGAKVA